jgi:hypothetical protein
VPSIITKDDLRAVLGVGAVVPDATLTQLCDAAEQAVKPYLRVKTAAGVTIDYSTVAVVKECTLAAAVSLWKTRTAPGGTFQAVDFTPGPWELGRSFFDRFEGPLAPYLNVGVMLG